MDGLTLVVELDDKKTAFLERKVAALKRQSSLDANVRENLTAETLLQGLVGLWMKVEEQEREHPPDEA